MLNKKNFRKGVKLFDFERVNLAEEEQMATLAATAIATTVTNIVTSSVVKEMGRTGLSVILVYSSHYGSTKIYDTICVPDGLVGYLQGFITTASPWCRLTLDFMKATENQYGNAILIGLSRLTLGALGI